MNAKAMTTTKRLFSGKTAPLHTLCKAITDCHHSTPNWTDSGYVVVRSENVKRGKISLEGASYTDQSTFFERISRSVPEPGDLIITREAPMGEVGMIPEGVQCCLGQRLVLVKPDALKIDRHYLLYAMQSPFVQKQIGASDETGSTVSNLRIPALKELAIPLLSGAKDIGAVLSALDAKIDLNHRINAELEALAKTIYDYWFVQFDFPDAHGRPYKSSGGAMVWNDTLKREIPMGWKAQPLSELGSFRNGINYDPSIGGDSVARIVDVRTVSATSILLNSDDLDELELDQADIDKYLVTADSILIARSGIPGATRMMQPCPTNTIYCGFIICLKVANAENKLLLFFRLKQLEQSLLSQSSGSILKNVSQDTLKDISLAVPRERSVIEKFNAAIAPLFEKISANNLENVELTQLRDWLLPLLMNGQVRVA